MNQINSILSSILKICEPEKIILFNKKIVISTESIKSADFCIIINGYDKSALMHDIYLKVESEIPFNLVVYTEEEWANLTSQNQSFAYRINEKGTVLYEKGHK